MPKIHLTRTNIDAIQPTGRQASYQDTKMPGFLLLMTPAGIKTFMVRRRIGGKDERVTIGRYPVFTPEMARKRAQELLGQMASGVNPKDEVRRKKKGGTVATLFASYLTHAKGRGKRSLDQDEDRFRLHLAVWADRSPESITRSEVRAWHQAIGEKSGKTTANRAAEQLRRIYRFGARQELLTCPSPTEGLEMFAEVERDRRLLPDELGRFVQALADEPNQDMADLFRLLLLTGQRLSSVREMRWADLDLTGQLWRIPMTKNGKPHTVALVGQAVEILKRRNKTVTAEWVFPGRPLKAKEGKEVEPIAWARPAWLRVCKRAGITDLRIHDLRHTFASLLTDDGASTKQVGHAVGHKDQRSTDRYMHASTEALRPVIEAALAPLTDLLADQSQGTSKQTKGPRAHTARSKVAAKDKAQDRAELTR